MKITQSLLDNSYLMSCMTLVASYNSQCRQDVLLSFSYVAYRDEIVDLGES